MVLEGVDAGQQFTVDGAEVQIGRGKGKTRRTGAIFLHDPSVSSEQATLRAVGRFVQRPSARARFDILIPRTNCVI